MQQPLRIFIGSPAVGVITVPSQSHFNEKSLLLHRENFATYLRPICGPLFKDIIGRPANSSPFNHVFLKRVLSIPLLRYPWKPPRKSIHTVREILEIVAYHEKCNPFVKLLLIRMHSGKNAWIFLISILHNSAIKNFHATVSLR